MPMTYEKKKVKWLLNSILFVSVMAYTVFYIFRNQDMGAMWDAAQSMSAVAVAAAALLAILYVAGEGCMIWYLLGTIGDKIPLLRCVGYSFVGFFFSGLTPSATGGQPMQLYYMKRDGISLSDSSVVLMTVAVLYKFVLVLTGAGMLLFWNASLSGYLHGGYYSLYFLGLSLNVLLVILLVLVMTSPRLIWSVLYHVDRFLVRTGIWKASEARTRRIQEFLDGYQKTVGFLKDHKSVIGVLVIGTFLQRFCLFILTAVVYWGLGLSDANLLDIVLLQGAIYVAVDMLPVPGAQGITEAMYKGVFGSIFTGNYLVASMCITRGISFYLVMLISLLVWCFLHLQKGKRRPERNH